MNSCVTMLPRVTRSCVLRGAVLAREWMPEHFPFGCCMCCRAPLFPSIGTVEQADTHTVYVMQGVFERKDAETRVSNMFTSPMNMSHVVSRAHASTALKFWWRLANGQAAVDFSVKDGFTRGVPTVAEAAALLAAKVDGLFFVNPQTWHTASETTAPYHAWWNLARGDGIAMPRFRAFVAGIAPKGSFQDANCTYPCCNHCNVGMDLFPRMRETLTSNTMGTPLVPHGCITVVKIVTGGNLREAFPKGDKREDRTVLSAVIAYYLHRCFRGTVNLDGLGKNDFTAKNRRVMLADLFWYCLVILCSCMERAAPVDDKLKRYSDHVYRGRINLYLGHLMYYMLRFEFGDDVGDFYGFYVFYFMEMWRLKAIWDFRMDDGHDDSELGALNDPAAFVWPPGSNVNGTPEILLKNMSVRIADLYYKYVRAVGCLIANKDRPARLEVAKWDAMKNFFVTGAEATELIRVHQRVFRFKPTQTGQAIHPFIINFGVRPILVPFVRGLSGEDDYFCKYVCKWLDWHVGLEKMRISSQYVDVSTSRAGIIHMVMHMLGMEEQLQGRGVTMHVAATRWNPGNVETVYSTYALRSVWKAAFSLRRIKFDKIGRYPTQTLLAKMGEPLLPGMRVKTRDA